MLANRWASCCNLSPHHLPPVALQGLKRASWAQGTAGSAQVRGSALQHVSSSEIVNSSVYFVWAQKGIGDRTALCPLEWGCQHLEQIIDQLSLVIVRAFWFALLRNGVPLRETSEWHKFSCEVREISFEGALKINQTVPKIREKTYLFWSSS